MNTYHVKVIVNSVQIYEVAAESQAEALDSWPDGKLIHTAQAALGREPLSMSQGGVAI